MNPGSAPAPADTSRTSRPTLGLTGLTINAMALIAPGAFLWLTFQMQSLYGAPMAGSAMWFGILAALLLCFATAISYAELSKLYPGAGSSYFFAEQAFLNKTKAYKFARIAKFITGWASHLYYWVYPGCMVGVTAILSGYLLNQFFPNSFSGTYNSPLFMLLFCGAFALGTAYIAFRGVTGTTGVNFAINVIQITALLVFSVMAISYRVQHPEGSKGWHLVNGTPVDFVVVQEPVLENGKPKLDAAGAPVLQNKVDADGNPVPELKDGKPVPFTLSYAADVATAMEPVDADHPKDLTPHFKFHPTAGSVPAPHGFSFIVIQACIAILILVGFESVTSMGEEARNARRDIPRAVLLSLGIQGLFCYAIEYFAAGYFLNQGYTLADAAGSGAPLGDMMVLVGTWLFGSYAAGRAFMLVQAATVFLALIGTTLSCLSTGARVTYAMGRDEEVPSHFGLLHGKRLTPHRAIWTLAAISAVIGMVTVSCYLGGTTPAALEPKYAGSIWYGFGIFKPELYAKLPNSLVIVTLVSNFGTFLLYMLTCIIAMVAFKEHQSFNGFKHMFVPLFGLVANLICMLFYLVGPFLVSGMSVKEPYIALGVCAVWGVYGGLYFLRSSKKKAKSVFVERPAMTA
ncbi:MAG TPA: APC family permease [Anaeromyxobacteraceae bacterium]|jgi:amino acid transporter|nr:APC family permease [Anaeromyxobacteraceae bacterium]